MPHNGNNLEIEVKFFLEDPETIRNQILNLGAQGRQKVFESNNCYDDSSSNIVKEGKLLRLRDDGRCHLTYKSRPSTPSNEYKIYEELEVTVSDFKTMDAILKSLGYHAARIYEKWRETFVLPDALLCIDTLPFGVFLEIEGTGSAIDHIAKMLGFKWEHRILRNYLSIFDILREKERLPFSDITFENFKNQGCRITPYLSLCQAGC